MPQLVHLVLSDPSHVDDVVRGWLEAGVRGLTIVDSTGLAQHLRGEGVRDDVPLFPSLRRMLAAGERHNRMLMSVIPDDLDLDRLVAATEAVVGRLDDHNTGILFVVPVTRVVGLQPGLAGSTSGEGL